jgi:hypothetical protein
MKRLLPLLPLGREISKTAELVWIRRTVRNRTISVDRRDFLPDFDELHAFGSEHDQGIRTEDRPDPNDRGRFEGFPAGFPLARQTVRIRTISVDRRDFLPD